MHKTLTQKLVQTLKKGYDALDNIFTDREAWGLFRIAAFVETFGWSCLIVGILAVRLNWPYGDSYLAIGGSVHGIFYLFYLFIVIFAHRSMSWGPWRFGFAQLISVVPFGALVFEWWVAARRRKGKK